MAACPVDRLRDVLVADLERQPDGVRERVFDFPEVIGAAIEDGGEHVQRRGEVACLLAVE